MLIGKNEETFLEVLYKKKMEYKKGESKNNYSTMANQIEMSTAEVPAQNTFRQTFHVFGKAVLAPRKNTFSFADFENNSNLPTQ